MTKKRFPNIGNDTFRHFIDQHRPQITSESQHHGDSQADQHRPIQQIAIPFAQPAINQIGNTAP